MLLRPAFFLCALCAGSLLWAVDTEPLRIGIYQNPPKIFTDNNGRVSGFYADITRAIMEDHGRAYEFVDGSWQEGLARLEEGSIDVMVDVAYSAERAERFLFSEETVFINWGVAYTRQDISIHSFMDLQGLRVAGMRGGIHSEGPQGLLSMVKQFEVDIVFTEYPDYRSCFAAIAAGEADVAVVNRLFGLEEEDKWPVLRSNVVFNPIALKYAFSPRSSASQNLITVFDESLRVLKANPGSPYHRAIERYLPGFVQHREVIPWWMKVLLPLISAFLFTAIVFVYALSRQIDIRKKLEKALMTAKDRAETANRAKSSFLANTSHEIRTPLNAVLGYAQILADDPQLDQNQRDYLRKIMAGGEHLLGIINSILDMSKIEAGQLELVVLPFDLRASVQSVYDLLFLKARSKGLDFSFELDESLAPRYLGDEAKFRQILLNLLNNALKFTEKGKIALEVKTSPMDNGGRHILRIIVQDTGPGVPEKNRERIFEPFEQVRSERESIEGTGLGLAISRQLARLMGGELTLEKPPQAMANAASQGARFLLVLPLAVVNPDNAVGNVNTLAPGLAAKDIRYLRVREPCLVLIADDRASNLDILYRMLIPYGFVVTTARDGREALAAYERERPRLVLLDYVMPEMNGLEVLEAIRLYEEKRHLTPALVFMVSASTLEEEAVRCMAAGAQAFIRKPFKKDELIALIADYIDFETEAIDREKGGFAGLNATEGSGPGARGRQASWPLGSAALRAALLEMDHGEREALRRSVLIGDLGAVRKIADTLAGEQPDLAQHLTALALGFDLTALKELFDDGE